MMVNLNNTSRVMIINNISSSKHKKAYIVVDKSINITYLFLVYTLESGCKRRKLMLAC